MATEALLNFCRSLTKHNELTMNREGHMEQQTIQEALEDLRVEVEHLRKTRELPSYELEWKIRELEKLRRFARQACTSTPSGKGAGG